MEYHVLSNIDMFKFPIYGVCVGMILAFGLFANLASRDASIVKGNSGMLRKVVPWLILCVFISELALLIYKLINYPWDIDPQPSQASAFRETQYLGSGYPFWGWANDYQLPVVSALTGCILWLCWTVYAFNFKPSDTSWWKKACKVIAYFILSATILGFNMHEFGDLWLYLGTSIIVAILLWVAKAKPIAKETAIANEEIVDAEEQVIQKSEPVRNEDPLRFMPKENVDDGTTLVQTLEPNMPEQPVECVEDENESISDTIVTANVDLPVVNEKEELHTSDTTPQTNETEMMYCKYCGKRIEADSTFCKYCGKKL